MRTLSRPMFNMGGPIKQGVMNGIREPHKHGERVGANLVGDPIYPKDKTGRAHHAVFGGLGIGALAAIARFGPAAYRGFKAARAYKPWAQNLGWVKRAKDILKPSGGLGAPMAEKGAGLGFRVGSLLRSNPITALSLAPQAGALGYSAAKGTLKSIPGLAKSYVEAILPGDQSGWWKDKEPPTGVPLNPNLQKLLAAVDTPDKPKKLSEAQQKAFANKQREERVQKYLDMMGYDRSKKTAIADALIDASKLVSDRGTLDLKNINRELINPVIQATSKRLDKPEQIREAVGLMSTKAEIEKDMSAETDALAKQLTTKRIEALDRQLEEGVGIDLLTYIGSQKGKVKPDQLERVARLSANKHKVPFTKVTDADMAAAGENASEEEIIQSVVGDDGVYMIGDALIEVKGGIPNRIV